MNYKNAKEIFPEELLRQIEKYASGQLVYFPNNKESKQWGSVSGKRKKLRERNINIKKEYKNGCTIEQLCRKYFLAYYTIRKIVYSSENS